MIILGKSAGAGAVVGTIAGHTGIGLAVGAAAGIAGGYLYDHHEKAQQYSNTRVKSTFDL